MSAANRRARRNRRSAMRNIVASCNSAGLNLSNTLKLIVGAETTPKPVDRRIADRRARTSPMYAGFDPRELNNGSRFPRPDCQWRHWSDAISLLAATA